MAEGLRGRGYIRGRLIWEEIYQTKRNLLYVHLYVIDISDLQSVSGTFFGICKDKWFAVQNRLNDRECINVSIFEIFCSG